MMKTCTKNSRPGLQLALRPPLGRFYVEKLIGFWRCGDTKRFDGFLYISSITLVST